jgi:hypothetical protein
VIVSYIREAHRCLKPGGLFKFQAQGDPSVRPKGSWLGAPLSLVDAEALARDTGFEIVRTEGAGTHYFWLWFRKPGQAPRKSTTDAPVEVHFIPARVQPGEEYTVRIPAMAGATIDVRYEFSGPRRVISRGVVGKWCVLDAKGEARIPVPETQPEGLIRVEAVRSRTARGAWRPANAEIRVTKSGPPSLI